MSRNLLTALATSLAVALTANTVCAATLFQFTGPTAQMPSPDSLTFAFNAGAGLAQINFTIDAFRTLDGIVANNLEDDFLLSENGAQILNGTWDLGGGGQDFLFFGPVAAVIDAHSNGFNHGGVLAISAPLILLQGQNTIRLEFKSAVPEGIDNEAWALRDLTVTGFAPTPEAAGWALMLTGFLGAGAGLRLRRRQEVA